VLSITTDYAADTGCPEPYLRRIAEAGFSHVHWCHEWNTNTLYASDDITQIAAWLRMYGLRLLDLHASRGGNDGWGSPQVRTRLAGVALVRNRIAMASALGSDVIILHLPRAVGTHPRRLNRTWDSVVRSLDALAPFAREHGVRIALENMARDDFAMIQRLLALYDADFLGLCYDAGHGNIDGTGLHHLWALRDRLISVHLHDNDGTSDQHRLPFTGSIDWTRLAAIVAASSYRKCISLEVSIHGSGTFDERRFLADAYDAGTRLAQMVVDAT
jgi:sugar phosphate isomerase/epimerase